MKQEIVEKFITKMWPDNKFEIINYELMPRFDFNESGQFVESDSAIFIDMRMSDSSVNGYEVSITLQKFTGYKFSITIF